MRVSMIWVLLVALGGAAQFGARPALADQGRVVHSFQGRNAVNDGDNALASLLKVGGALYGTTYAGGDYDMGTIFKVDLSTMSESVVYSFKGEKNKGEKDGANPQCSLLNVGGKLYGTTYYGGGSKSGTVFEFNPSNGAERVVHAFDPSKGDGAFPSSGLIYFNGMLYSTTYSGGAGGVGTVFEVNPGAGTERVVYSFRNDGHDGAYPSASLLNVGGILWGTTYYGGTTNKGAVFRLNPATRAERVVHSFTGSANGDGDRPIASLIGVSGVLYGTTHWGGNSDAGTVFKVNPRTNKTEIVYSFQIFQKGDGGFPAARLLNVAGALYGTTRYGGIFQAGSVFRLNPASGDVSVVYSFKENNDGRYPYAGLINVGGTLYGTTYAGGEQGKGTVFAVAP